MGQATYILAINVLAAGLFAAAFGWISTYARVREPARWIAASFVAGMLGNVGEWLVSVVENPRLSVFGAFSLLLIAFAGITVALSRQYRRPVPWLLLGLLLAVSLPVNLAIYDMERGSLLRVFLYQFPYFVVLGIGAWTVLSSKSRGRLDVVLGVTLSMASLHFLTKPFLARALGPGNRPQDYIDSIYALVSQSMGSVLIVATGLFMAAVLVRDVLVEATEKSETDLLTGLLNRRGFEERARLVGRAIAKSNLPASIVICDLDHFKSINDSYGHAVGDKVIEAFSSRLHEAVDENHIAGRIGGEEFAVILPGVNAPSARLFAEGVRSAFAAAAIEGLPPSERPTASFGVAELTGSDTLSDMLRRADLALYEAKNAGRDCVRVAAPFFNGSAGNRRAVRDN